MALSLKEAFLAPLALEDMYTTVNYLSLRWVKHLLQLLGEIRSKSQK